MLHHIFAECCFPHKNTPLFYSYFAHPFKHKFRRHCHFYKHLQQICLVWNKYLHCCTQQSSKQYITPLVNLLNNKVLCASFVWCLLAKISWQFTHLIISFYRESVKWRNNKYLFSSWNRSTERMFSNVASLIPAVERQTFGGCSAPAAALEVELSADPCHTQSWLHSFVKA